MVDETKLERTFQCIDDANRADPSMEGRDEHEVPAALLYGQRMSAWVDLLKPGASEALKIAARAQHIRRWEIPRSDFPMDRAGYHKWRTTLYAFHGEKAAEIMRETGYDDDAIERVRQILSKKKLKTDPDVQTLEDAAALVFLEHHLADFAARDDMAEEKLIDILQKTWRKMSEQGQQEALKLKLSPELQEIVSKAVSSA